jgi:hypothetical protein
MCISFPQDVESPTNLALIEETEAPLKLGQYIDVNPPVGKCALTVVELSDELSDLSTQNFTV